MHVVRQTVIKSHASPMGECNQTLIMVRNGYLELTGAFLCLIAGTVVCQEYDWPDSSRSSLYVGGASPRE